MDCKITLTPCELQALVEFLKDHVNKETLSAYNSIVPKHLFLAFLKLNQAKEQWEEIMAYTD